MSSRTASRIVYKKFAHLPKDLTPGHRRNATPPSTDELSALSRAVTATGPPRKRKIVSAHDPVIEHLMKLSTNRSYRLRKETCVVSGWKLLRELSDKYVFKRVLTTDALPSDHGIWMEEGGWYQVDQKLLRRVAHLKSFDGGIVGEIDMPAPTDAFGDPRLMLVFDYIEDPALLGTLLRSAVSMHWHGAFFLPTCVDPLHHDAIRASQGALFYLPHRYGTLDDLMKFVDHYKLCLTAAHYRGADITQQDFTKERGVCLMVREEYYAPFGIPQKARKLRIEHPVDLPDFDMRNLDVAVSGSLLMYQMKHHHFPEVSRSPFVASPSRGRALDWKRGIHVLDPYQRSIPSPMKQITPAADKVV
ncbi:unnamed protein product [Vitrella brassicaformis CCMP3155]|uniref:tRNA/rRNA methyltransferase SpoU type domain-containing protein n=1 Tax=Vitrella brassicaformis (strain CCMP3155) TaxID=1169540 RepID=A0A0G4FPV0_VITBC|nr:unnamed protein product [Vitrella brassicaformis CCMP3155]|eukprot:CEM16469.1 unnamed protein product [Vitrella brassicaformis CCMP3155]